ncbi:hypothetical protein ACC772_39920, partial [Rhizobium ruizarguesonis]
LWDSVGEDEAEISDVCTLMSSFENEVLLMGGGGEGARARGRRSSGARDWWSAGLVGRGRRTSMTMSV